ncbi:MAG: hypothetical protein HYY06_24890 [Deltaproteobacteria bacterium]|nr:hypothetical protein [Deltaproteobacteria bacterium]
MELVIGIDENGLGPRLGPMIATAVALEVERYDEKRLARSLRRIGFTDSKDVAGFGSMAAGEARALAIVRAATGSQPATLDALVRAVSLKDEAWLRATCPTRGHEPCWQEPLALPAWSSPGQIAAENRALERALERSGVRLVAVRSSLLCASRLNERLSAGMSKSRVDLCAFEELALALVDALGREARVICGRVGMLKFYDGAFGPLSSLLRTTLEESDTRSHYRVLGVGEIEFTVDADRHHAPVALASLVGKLLREGFVARMNAFYASRVPGLRHASGYNDPVTAAFIEETRDARRVACVPDRCFERLR